MSRVASSLLTLVTLGVLACSMSPGAATTTATAVTTTPPLQTTTTTAPVLPPEQIEIELSGQGPLGLDLVDGQALVAAHDSNQLIVLDLATATETATIPVGDYVQNVAAMPDGRVALGRYESSTTGGLGLLDLGTMEITNVRVEAVQGVSVDEEGNVWVVEKAGAVVLVDPATAEVVSRLPIDIVQNEHLDIVAFAGSGWASSDSTPIRRVGGDPLAVEATIETGGGIPLDSDGGLLWGARADEVWAIDPATNEVARRISLENVAEILALDVSGDEAWIAIRHPGRVGAVIRLDLANGEVLGDFPMGLPAAVRIGPDRVWVTDYEADRLVGFAR
ncbi:MAG: hypothetical protein WD651_13480 [Acidimicrobiia bacterium]